MRKYDRYKPSHIAWMGAVPETWQIQRIKTVLESEQNGTWGDDVKGDGNDVYCIRVADFNKSFDQLDRYDNTIRNVPHRDFQVRQLKVGDLLIEKSGGGETSPVGRVGIYNWSDRKAVTSNFMARLRPKATRVISKFLFYVFKSMYSIGVNSKSIKQTTGIQNMDTYSYFNECIALPPLEEQTAIANYLDEKTAQIDTLIEKKQKLIELLKEERKAIINEAVSGEGKNWERKKLKYVLRVNSGEAIASSNIDSEGTYPVYGGNGIMGYTEEYNSDNSDIIIGRVGAKCGNVRLVNGKKWISDNALIATVYNDYSREYVALLLEAMNLNSMANQNAQPLITGTMVKDKVAYFPEPLMQIKIVERVKVETKRIDATIEKIETEIGLMHEYKIALISEVVTGKIKVV